MPERKYCYHCKLKTEHDEGGCLNCHSRKYCDIWGQDIWGLQVKPVLFVADVAASI